MSENLTPAVRFNGFTDAWEQRKLGDFVRRESNSEISSVECPSVEYEDVISEIGRLNKDIRQKEVQKKGVPFDGTQVLYGKLRPYLHNWMNPDFKGIAVGDWWVLKPINVNKNFLYRLIQTKKFDEVANQSSGSKMPRADWSLVSNTEFIIPVSLAEQQQIGAFFQQLDKLIALRQRKLELLRQLKKAMLQQMFPDKGKNTPQVRFQGFNDTWEQRKLGEVTDVRDGTHSSPKYIQRGHPFITSKNVSNGFINYENIQYISDGDYEEINKRSKVDVHDILMGMIGTIGNLALIREEPDFAIKNVALIKYSGGIDYQYLYQALQSSFVTSQLSSSLDGGTQKFVSLKRIRELEIAFPNEPEQQQIGSFFHNLDNLITLYQRKLERIEQLKKFLLQRMFV